MARVFIHNKTSKTNREVHEKIRRSNETINSPRRINMTGDARKTALFVLGALDKGRKTLDQVLEDVVDNSTLLSKRDRALLYAMVYGVLRWRNRLDWIIDHFSNTRIDKINPKILNTLRLGLFQIAYLNRIPASAAVNTSVEMAKMCGGPWVVRYVNALLRSAARGYQNVPFPDPEKDPPGALAAGESFPKWLIQRWLDRFGFEETKALCDAVNEIPPITVRINTLRTGREILIHALQGKAEKIQQTTYAPDGLSFLHPATPIHKMKPFDDGWFQVQDEAAQLVSLVLNPQPGETVLDACAGLGGKTGHIAQLMKNCGTVVAMDNNPEKLKRLESEMQRMGITTVSTVRHNLNNPIDKDPYEMYDRVLLDSPCSGLGVLRRNPDTKWSMSAKKFKYYKQRQKRFLDTLSKVVKPSGIIVYSVCSIEPEENEDVVKDFLNSHPIFDIVNNPEWLPVSIRSLIDQEGFLKTFPHRHNMDGFFAVCLKRLR